MANEQEERAEIARMVAQQNAQCKRFCEENNLNEEQRQELMQKLEMDQLLITEHARELGTLLDSANGSGRRAALKIIDLIRGEILNTLTPIVEALDGRVRQLEKRAAKSETGQQKSPQSQPVLAPSDFEALSKRVDARLSAIFDGYQRGHMSTDEACALLRRVDAALQPVGKPTGAV